MPRYYRTGVSRSRPARADRFFRKRSALAASRIQDTRRRDGQSLIEACLAIVLICLIFMGMVQISQLFAAREILDYAAGRSVRAKTVGLNSWMVKKCAMVAAIPNAGRIEEPAFTNIDLTLQAQVSTLSPGALWDWVLSEATPPNLQFPLENARIPFFLGAEDVPDAFILLDYEDWDSVDTDVTATGLDGGMLNALTSQAYPLRMPMHRAFYADDEVELHGEASMENHYPLYLEDWDL